MSIKRDEIMKCLEEMTSVVELLYQNKIQEAMKEFETVLINMQEIVDFFFLYRQEHEDFSFDEAKMKGIFEEVVSAMEAKDYTLLGDLINYEFMEYIKELNDRI